MVRCCPSESDNTAYEAFSRTSTQQATLLASSGSQKAFQQIKDDSTSLIVLCDSASFETRRTRTTTATSRFSLKFNFDAELLQQKVYKNTLKSLMRRVSNRQSRATEVDSQGTVSGQACWIRTFLETDSHNAISELRLKEVEILAIVAHYQVLINAILRLGGLIFEDKKRIARERMVHWALTYLASSFDMFGQNPASQIPLNLEPGEGPKSGEAVRQLANGLKNMYSRPGSLHPESIIAAQWLLPRIDDHRFNARRQDGAK